MHAARRPMQSGLVTVVLAVLIAVGALGCGSGKREADTTTGAQAVVPPEYVQAGEETAAFLKDQAKKGASRKAP